MSKNSNKQKPQGGSAPKQTPANGSDPQLRQQIRSEIRQCSKHLAREEVPQSPKANHARKEPTKRSPVKICQQDSNPKSVSQPRMEDRSKAHQEPPTLLDSTLETDSELSSEDRSTDLVSLNSSSDSTEQNHAKGLDNAILQGMLPT
ncbi:hypothetical protein P175DRAFT_0558598 [Aspergillus ochraceoroseus IBT 24754]|uniref:Uncharacterized protein n=1 Tax=Aspergillus ochraceoroseus IBT 24754 TaxID=1392256 RepID=A0A2T5LVV2_9EURO|nr:uncharacterized protein P175DRAFT_0558598 [Aspergillus ochraceoroseus IBT 24754]PTU20417.1 hypothetical protein P175DRAFT_0558598 [Aspergillus ochraceoroseus IBT 24754]